MDDYNTLLNKAYSKIKLTNEREGRFEIIELDALVQGKKTIVKNFQATAKNLAREAAHMAKYFAKETGAVGNIESGKLILNRALLMTKLNQVYNAYIDSYVLCRQCKKPDTKFVNEKGVQVLKCEACGAITPVKKL
jgi:translation initiation factor 2 subunit 2